MNHVLGKREKRKKKKKEHLHYTTVKNRKLSLLADLLASLVSKGLYIGKRGFYEMRPRVENRRVARQDGRENVAMAAFLQPYQGLRSLVLASGFRYSQIWLLISRFSSDTRQLYIQYIF